MYITITIEAEGIRRRISIDERQRVLAAYAILARRGLVTGDAVPALYKSALLDEWIQGEPTFKDQGIVGGDLLTAQW